MQSKLQAVLLMRTAVAANVGSMCCCCIHGQCHPIASPVSPLTSRTVHPCNHVLGLNVPQVAREQMTVAINPQPSHRHFLMRIRNSCFGEDLKFPSSMCTSKQIPSSCEALTSKIETSFHCSSFQAFCFPVLLQI